MNIVKRNAWDIDKYFNGPNLFDDFFKVILPEVKMVRGHDKHFSPQVNLLETDNQHIISIATPGLTKKDLNVEIENNLLTVSYEKKEENNNIFIERSFSRQWSLPEGADSDSVNAEFKNGVLAITVNKPTPSEPQSHIVKIK